jgi:hypothetical protein
MSDYDRVAAFIRKLSAHGERLGGGKVGLDSLRVRRLVAEDPEAAAAAVFAYCEQGKAEPTCFQLALAIAAACQVELGDDSLMQRVQKLIDTHGAPPPMEFGSAGTSPTTSVGRQRPIRQLCVPEEDLVSGNITDFVRLFMVQNITPDQWNVRREICGTCILIFPSTDADPRPVTLIPEVRRFIENLHDRLPYYPVFLNMNSNLGMFFAYFGCLADRSVISKDGTTFDITHRSVVSRVLESLVAISNLADALKIDYNSVAASIVAVYPPPQAEILLAIR